MRSHQKHQATLEEYNFPKPELTLANFHLIPW